MPATQTTPSFRSWDKTNVPNTAYEARIIALEGELQSLLEWQRSVASTFSLAFAVPIAKSQVGYDGVVDKSVESGPCDDSKFIGKEIPLTPAATPPRASSPPPVEEVSVTLENESSKIASRILDVIEGYSQHLHEDNNPSGMWIGRAKFLPRVEQYVEAGHPVKMIIPAFPWKSVNRVDKVTGALPDLGEELAFARLNCLCNDIGKVYEHGAQITIATDGLLFDDLIGISDEDTWDYSVALIEMAALRGFDNIKLVRVMTLLGLTTEEEMTKERYLSTVTACRQEIDSVFRKPDEAVRELIMTDADTTLTYRGFLKFLGTDLRYSSVTANAKTANKYKAIVKKVAVGMMARAESFTKIIMVKCPGYVRLSIHPSSGAAKVSVPLIPQTSGSFPRSPWHSSIAVGVDGSYSTLHAKDVRETHNLVYRNGRPYCFREKSDLWDWGMDEVDFEHIYPRGVLVTPKSGPSAPGVLGEAELGKLKQLAALQSPVAVRGFVNVTDGDIASGSD